MLVLAPSRRPPECLRGRGLGVSRQLLQHECPQCPALPPFGLFGDLEQHMRKQHELFCCKLCLKHLKVRPRGRGRSGQPGGGWAPGVVGGAHRAQHPLPCRSSPTSASGTRARTWRDTECRGTPTTRRTVDTRSASSVMSATWTTTSCSNTCAATTTSATSVTRTGPRTTTGGRGPWAPAAAGRGGGPRAGAGPTQGAGPRAPADAPPRQRLRLPARALPGEALPVRGGPLQHGAVHARLPHRDRPEGPQDRLPQPEPRRGPPEPPDRPAVQLRAPALAPQRG